MTTLYLWNDLPLFGMSDIGRFEDGLADACDAISTAVHRVQLIGFESWRETVSRAMQVAAAGSAIVTIGSRPGRAMKAAGRPHIQLPLQRERTADGATTGFRLVSGPDVEQQVAALGRCSQVLILEDVIMTGGTFRHIHGVLDRWLQSDCRVTWVVLFSAQATKSALSRQFGRRIISRHLVAGRPTVDFTIMCLSDLLYGSIGNTRYRDSKQLMSQFFSSPIEPILSQLGHRVPGSIEGEYHAN